MGLSMRMEDIKRTPTYQSSKVRENKNPFILTLFNFYLYIRSRTKINVNNSVHKKNANETR